MGEVFAVERRMEPAMLDVFIEKTFLLTADDIRRLE
jgi:hypothetical protein